MNSFRNHCFWGIPLVLVAITVLGCEAPDRTVQDEVATDPVARDVPPGDDPIERGRASFMLYCGSCHGPEGRGDGPVAPVLTVPMPDLTLLRAEHDGTYPFELVYNVIDGREQVRPHGTREMPVWGNIWTEQEGEEVADLRIRELVEYVRSIQREI